MTRGIITCVKCGRTATTASSEGLCPQCVDGAAARPAAGPASGGTIVLSETDVLAAASNLSSRFGDYELIEEVARGGMGVVYKARQVSLNRLVAVKMILHGRFNNPEFVQRFRAEAQAAANLHHPNIVAIYEIGEEAGQHYFSMEFVEGRDLASLVRQQPLPARTAAQHVRTIAEAIHYAHRNGILHRDLKPSNVLIDTDGQPRITDFGLAKRLAGGGEGASSAPGSLSDVDALTITGQVLGSPSYMPPEQAEGHSKTVDARSDVYSLGAILYCLVTGRPPFAAETIEATLGQVVQSPPPSPRLLNATVPKDIETICLKCLEKEPAKRYATAQELADDLKRFLEHEPIRARAVGPFGKTWRWCVRKPALAGVGAVAMLLLGVIAVGSPVAVFRINRARVQAEQRELKERRNAYGADMGNVQQAVDRGSLGYAQQLLLSHQPAPGQIDVRGWEWRYLWELCHSTPPKPLARHAAEINGVSVSPDGRWIASLDNKRMLKLWNVSENREALAVPGCSGPAAALSENFLAACDGKGAIRFWSLQTLQNAAPPIESPGPVSRMQFHPDGQRLLTYGENRVRVWDVPSRRLLGERIVPRASEVGSVLALSRDGSTIAVSSGRRQVTILRDDSSERVLETAHIFTVHPLCLGLSRNGRMLATGVAAGVGTAFRVEIWDVENGRQTTNFLAHEDTITSINFSIDDTHLITTSYDRTVEVRETATWRTVAVLKSPNHTLSLVTLVPPAAMLVSGGQGGAVYAWDVQPADSKRDRMSLSEDLAAEIVSESLGAISPDASAIVALRTNGTGVLIHPRNGSTELALPFQDARRVAIGSTGRLLAVARASGVVTLWNTDAGTRLADLQVPAADALESVALSPDERWLAAVTKDRRAILWRVQAEPQRSSWPETPTRVATVRFSPDSTRLACGHNNGTISLWDVASGRPLAELTGHESQINRIAISSDGRRLASTSWDSTVRVWDLATRKQLKIFPASRSSFFRVAFSPDGRRLAANEWVDTLLFDLEAERQVARLKSFTPVFLDADTVLGLSTNELWQWRPPSFQAIDALQTRLER